MQPIKILHDYCLPRHFQLFGVIALIFGAIFFSQHMNATGLAVSAISVALGLLTLTARYGLEIDPSAMQYKEFVRLLWLRYGEWKRYDGVEKIFINRLKVSERMVTRTGAKYDIRSMVYQAYITFSDGSKIELDSDRNKDKLLLRLQGYNQQLQTTIQDNSL